MNNHFDRMEYESIYGRDIPPQQVLPPKPGDAEFIGALPSEGTGGDKWTNPDGTTRWPPNDGAVPGTEKTITLQPGETIGRIGDTGGTYTAPPGTSPAELSLKPGTNTSVYTEYTVVKPIPKVTQAEVAPWFDQPGGGIQYKLLNSIQWYIDNGYILEK